MCTSAWTSRCAAPSRTAPARCARISTAIRKQTPISWPRVRRDARGSGKAASRCRRSSLFPIDFALNDEAAVPRHGGDGREAWRPARRADVSWRSAECQDRCGARQDVRGRDGERPRSRFPCGRKRFTRCALARPDRRGRAAPQVQGPHRRRPLLLARARRRQRARHHHREGRRSRHRGRVAADVQHVSAGPRRPAARRAGAVSRPCTSSMPPASP